MEQAHLRQVGGEIERVVERVGQLADSLGLRNYTFEVEVGHLPPGELARCACVEGRSLAKITVAEGFTDWPEAEQTETLIHEVLHPLFDKLMRHVTDLRGELSRAHYETLERVFRRDLEHAIDTLAGALARLL